MAAFQQVVTGANTATQLPSNTFKNGVIIEGSPTNTAGGVVAVGFSSSITATSASYRLSPGQPVFVYVTNSSALWIYSANAGDGVDVIGS